MTRRRDGRALAAVATVAAPVRCAVYTRKSTDEGLDRDFTTLDNQRERGEAFAVSQGWSVLLDRFDDGGYSGGTTDRPALQQLLARVPGGSFDTVLVYKLDRISRSLVDFLNIHAYLEKHGVALVSVTESINTKTPHGRMMVNVLVSFGQYERELIGERTRDKMRAARRRGRWTGGRPPLGFNVAPEGGKLLVNRVEAQQVRAIFELYCDLESLVATSQELNRRGWSKKTWTTKSGRVCGGGTWDRVTLHRFLTDPIYIGLQKLAEETFPGEHPAIVSKALFARVDAILAENGSTGGSGRRNRHGALLRGLLRCSACNAAMVFHPVRRGAKLHRYYTCRNAQRRGFDACPTKSLPADEVEAFVVDRIRCVGADPELQKATFEQAVAQVKAQRRGLRAEAKRLDRSLAETRRAIEKLVATLTDTNGAARTAVQSQLEEAQQRVHTIENRLAEIRAEQADLDAQNLDPTDLARALEAFDPVWDALLTPEKERVLRLLIAAVRYDGAIKRLEIDFRLSGIAELAKEVDGVA